MPSSKNGHSDASTPSGSKRRPPVDDSPKAQLEISPKILSEAPPRSHSEPSNTPPTNQPALQQISPYQQPGPYEQAHPNPIIINQGGVREESCWQKTCFCCCCTCPVWLCLVLILSNFILSLVYIGVLYAKFNAEAWRPTTPRP